MLSHDTAVELVAAYALDALDAAERPAFEAHLALCVACQREVAACRAVTVAMATSVDPLEPPPALRARALAGATAGPQRARAMAPAPPGSTATPTVSRSHWAWLAAAAGVILAVGSAMYASSLKFQLDETRSQLRQSSSQVSTLRDQLAEARTIAARLLNAVNVMGAGDMIKITLRGQGAAAAAAGTAYLSASKGANIDLEGLPVLPAGKIYQLWLIPKGQVPVSGGVFNAAANGTASVQKPMPAGMPMPQMVAVTIEDGPAGVGQSANQPVVLGSVGQ